MGEARRRGTFDKRKSQTLAKREAELEERRKAVLDNFEERALVRKPCSEALLLFGLIGGGYDGVYMFPYKI